MSKDNQSLSNETPKASRRAILAGAPAAAAGALLAGTAVNLAAVTVAQADGLDWPAIVLRAEGMIHRLRRYYGPDKWTAADEDAAAQVLKYYRGQADEDDEAGWDVTLEFFNTHNQSFDWVVRGDPVTMIGTMAARSRRAIAGAESDDPAIAVVNEYYSADQVYLEVLETDPDGGEGHKGTAAFNRHDKAMTALFNVTPVTFAGAVALLEAIADHDDDEPRGTSPLEWWAAGRADMAKAVNDTLLEIAEVLRTETV